MKTVRFSINRVGWKHGQDIFREDEKDNPLAIPVLIRDFKETPPTLIILAEHDPLLDDGKQLSANMENAGIKLKNKPLQRYGPWIYAYGRTTGRSTVSSE